MKILYLIPARSGSKGVLNKNVRLLDGKPLIYYTITAAIEAACDINDICVSTDSEEIRLIAENYGLNVPFLRPEALATDFSTSEQVINHALDFYKSEGRCYDYIVYLQPTSPLRNSNHINEALSLISPKKELIVSVKETDSNPYYVLFEESNIGFLKKCKNGIFTRRQDCPKVYELNGAIYVIKVDSFINKGYQNLRMSKYVMPKSTSIDIDDVLDFHMAELILSNQLA